MTDEEILTRRLRLPIMQAAFLDACLADDVDAAQAQIGLRVPIDWLAEHALMQLRLEDLRADPDYLRWSLRAIGLRATAQMAGFIGFHSPPNPPYLQPLVSDAVELGYTVFPAFRSQGIATEAIAGLIQWARRYAGVSRFVVSIAPDNAPSRAIAARLGFRRIGEHVDEFDAVEEIFLLACDGPAALRMLPDASDPIRSA